jgi:hypothetical protein
MSLEFDNHPAKLAAEQPGKQSTRRFRFSLRVLFLVATIAAALAYWAVSPTLHAQQFLRALHAANYKVADECFRSQESRFLLDLYDKHWRFITRANLEPWTFAQLLSGKREIRLHVAYGDAGPMRSLVFNVFVTSAGLLAPEQVFRGASSGMGIASR